MEKAVAAAVATIAAGISILLLTPTAATAARSLEEAGTRKRPEARIGGIRPAEPERERWRNTPARPPQSLSVEPDRPALLAIRVNQTTQRLSVSLQGQEVEGLDSVPVSTGVANASRRTPDGLFWINPFEIKQRRKSSFASRLLKRPVFLTHAIQIVGGIFMHDASYGAMAHLGTKRSYGCVRVDRRKMPAIFDLAKQYRFNTRVHIFHETRCSGLGCVPKNSGKPPVSGDRCAASPVQ